MYGEIKRSEYANKAGISKQKSKPFEKGLTARTSHKSTYIHLISKWKDDLQVLYMAQIQHKFELDSIAKQSHFPYFVFRFHELMIVQAIKTTCVTTPTTV